MISKFWMWIPDEGIIKGNNKSGSKIYWSTLGAAGLGANRFLSSKNDGANTFSKEKNDGAETILAEKNGGAETFSQKEK